MRKGKTSAPPTGILEQRTPAEPKEWLKDIDLARTAENMLVGIILFFGRYPVTFFDVLFRPAALRDQIILDPAYRSDSQVRFTRPVTFLVVSGFLYLAFALSAFGTFAAVEFIVAPFKWLIERMPKKVDELNLENIALFMVPFVLAVALYAYLASVLFRLFGSNANFKVHLNLSCYISGAVALTFTLHVLAASPAWDLALNEGAATLHSVPLLAIYGGTIVLLALILYRHLELARRAGSISWIRTTGATATSVIAFYAASLLLMFLLAPILKQLT